MRFIITSSTGISRELTTTGAENGIGGVGASGTGGTGNFSGMHANEPIVFSHRSTLRSQSCEPMLHCDARVRDAREHH